MLPLSISREIARLDRRIAQVVPNDELDLEIHEIVQGLSHCLDRGMSILWERIADKTTTKAKPNIYFPCYDTKERLDKRLKEIGFGDLSKNHSAIYEEVSKAQPYAGGAIWLKHLKSIANLKHERPPKIAESFKPGGVGVGMGSDVYIKDLSVVSFPPEVLHMLEETEQDAKGFVLGCCSSVRGLLSRILKD